MSITRRSFVAAFMAAAAGPALAADRGQFLAFAHGDVHVCTGDSINVQTGPRKWAHFPVERTGVVRGVRVYRGGHFELEWAQHAIAS